MDPIKIMSILLVQLKCIERSIDEIKDYYSKKNVEIAEVGEPGFDLKKILFSLVNLKLSLTHIQKVDEASLTEEEKTKLLKEKVEIENILEELSANKLFNSVLRNIIISFEDSNAKISFKSEAVMQYFLKSLEDRESDKGKGDRSYEMQTVLINLCRAFENFSSEILRALYLDNTKQKELLEKPISYKDLLTFSSLDEVKDFLVEDYLDRLFRESFNTWYVKITSVLGMGDSYKKEVLVINEAFQRRNLYVHANGKVNKHYLQNVECDDIKVNIGDTIETNLGYLNCVFNAIEDICWWMFYRLSLRVFNGFEGCFERTNDFLLQNFNRNRNSIAKIYDDFIKSGHFSVRQHKICEVNYFLFYRMNNRIPEVIERLKAFDVSGCAIEFQLCKEILLDGNDLDDKSIAYFETLDDETFFYNFEWPVMSFVREKPKVEAYFQQRFEKCLDI